MRGGSFDGFGVTATYSWLPSDYLAFGPVLDLAALGGGGKSGNGLGSSYSFLSTFIGPSLQLRLPVGAFLPYADVGIGYLGVFQVRSSNTQCDYGAGFGARLGVGLNAAVSALRVGVRGSARQAGGALSCAAVFGPATFDASLLFALGATADYRW